VCEFENLLQGDVGEEDVVLAVDGDAVRHEERIRAPRGESLPEAESISRTVGSVSLVVALTSKPRPGRWKMSTWPFVSTATPAVSPSLTDAGGPASRALLRTA